MTERANYLLYKIICLLFFSLGLLQILIKHLLIVIVLIVTCQIQATCLSVRQSLYVISLKEVMGSGCSRCTPCHDHAYFMGPRDPKDIVEDQKFTGQNSLPFSLHGNLLISVKQARGRVFNEDTLLQVRLS